MGRAGGGSAAPAGSAPGGGPGAVPRGAARSPPRGGLQTDPPSSCVLVQPGVGHGECVAGLLRVELGERLGLQLPGGGPKPPVRGPPGCPPSVSMPSEFSNISWMSGGIEPGISIFSVITRSAPAGGGTGGGQRGGGCWHRLSSTPQIGTPKQHLQPGSPTLALQNERPELAPQSTALLPQRPRAEMWGCDPTPLITLGGPPAPSTALPPPPPRTHPWR